MKKIWSFPPRMKLPPAFAGAKISIPQEIRVNTLIGIRKSIRPATSAPGADHMNAQQDIMFPAISRVIRDFVAIHHLTGFGCYPCRAEDPQ